MCGYLRKGQRGWWERDVSHTLQYRGGRPVGVWQDLFCVAVVGRARALLPSGPTAGPALFLRGLATGFPTADETGTLVQGTFYEPELQRVTVDDDTLWRIEKVLKRRGDQWYVQWKGWPRKYDSWIRRQDLAS